MGDKSAIQWTEATWNPTTGCTRVSPGCDHCYAFALHDERHHSNREAARAALPNYQHDAPSEVLRNARNLGVRLPFPAQYDVPFSKVQVLGEERLTQPLRWRKPRRVFVDSMSDLFHEDVPDEAIDRVFAVMSLAPQHTFQVLTKRPERMRAYVVDVETKTHIWGEMISFDLELASDAAAYLAHRGHEALSAPFFDADAWPWPLPNVWLGTSVEDQARADERVPLLLETPAAVRFLSCEPLLGPVDLIGSDAQSSALHCYEGDPKVDWVIVGGESGSHARPFDVGWARALREQCRDAGVAFFMKQLGAHPTRKCGHGFASVGCPGSGGDAFVDLYHTDEARCEGHAMVLRNRHGSDMAEWPADLRVREFPEGGASAS